MTMHATWFAILAIMLTAYAVLDGFDFGAGIVHFLVAKTEPERRLVLAAIGPLWDGNEVCLIAAGGVLVFAFPRAYAAAFSGLYLPLMMVLWLLVLRGLSIEFRSQSAHPLWRSGWDATFSGASAALAIVLGVALGNVLRGVPLGQDGYFHEDLFASAAGRPMGAIDPFTAMYGLFALVVLAAHGATFLAWKTTGAVLLRSCDVARKLWIGVLGFAAVATVVTALIERPYVLRVVGRPWLWPLVPLAMGCAVTTHRALSSGRELRAFLASCGFIASMLFATAGALYPTLLRSSIDDAFTLDVHNTASAPASLSIGLWVWIPATALAIGYFGLVFRLFRGKATSEVHH